MENEAKGTNPEEIVTDEQLKEVAGGNKIHKRRIEQLETHDSSKNNEDDKGINVHELRLEGLDRRDSSK
ncbi:MAG: hypothetical protein AAFP03_08670 [Cyanobacteria bacterium J06598_3]